MRVRARHLHHLEVIADMTSGYLINVFVFVVIYNMILGHNVSIWENMTGGLVFMAIAYVRKYFWRRTFNKWIGQIYEARKVQEQAGTN